MPRRCLTALIAISILLIFALARSLRQSHTCCAGHPDAHYGGRSIPHDGHAASADRSRPTGQTGHRRVKRDRRSSRCLGRRRSTRTLARLRFERRLSDEVSALIKANTSKKPWLADSLRPLLEQSKVTQAAAAKAGANTTIQSEAYAPLRAMLQSLSPEQRAGLNALSSIDDDGDGLTNTQEAWLCTDPNNPDSDNDGVSDYVEVFAAKEWLVNRRSAYPASGTPYKSWPMVPGDANFNATCIDHDQDVVPDAAETWELGLNPNRESTSGDKFDDGQKLFGLTKVGWGPRPGLADNGFIVGEMPSFVKAPGNHPFVAAFPVPEISVVPGTWHVSRVTTITTQQGMMMQSEKTYGSSVTRGTSDSIANTVTWNNWEEVSQAIQTPLNTTRWMRPRSIASPSVAPIVFLGLLFAGASALFAGVSAGSDVINTHHTINDQTGKDAVDKLMEISKYQQELVVYGTYEQRTAC